MFSAGQREGGREGGREGEREGGRGREGWGGEGEGERDLVAWRTQKRAGKARTRGHRQTS